jgi:hypothetical protein
MCSQAEADSTFLLQNALGFVEDPLAEAARLAQAACWLLGFDTCFEVTESD